MSGSLIACCFFLFNFNGYWVDLNLIINMYRSFLTSLFSIIFFATNAQTGHHVILISIDGLRPDFYRDARWPAPALRRLVKQGTSAEGVRTIFPSLTYPSHTSIITGANPSRHGIFYNQPFEPQGVTGKWYWESSYIKVPTLFEAVQKKGLTSAAFYWPVSVGAPIDYNVPVIWPVGPGSDKALIQRQYTKPSGLWEELEREATGTLNRRMLNSDFASGDENGSRIIAHIIRTYKPAFVAFHILAVDHAQHDHGRNHEKVEQAVAIADHAVNNVLEAIEQAGIKQHTTVIITGDHGFVDTHSSLSPNIWLHELGFFPKDSTSDNWKAQFHPGGGSAFLFLKDRDDMQTFQSVRAKLRQLPDVYRKLFRVVERAELDSIGADPTAALALAPIEGVTFARHHTGEVLRRNPGGAHGYYPDIPNIRTGFIAVGPGIRKNAVIPKISITDIAPLIAQLLGLSFTAPDGRLPENILLPAGGRD